MLQVKFEKLGPITEGEIKINKLTLLCGENNTGKTYASYSIYGLLQETKAFIGYMRYIPIDSREELVGVTTFDIDLNKAIGHIAHCFHEISSQFSDKLYKLFSSRKENFTDSKVSEVLDERSLEDYLYNLEFVKSVPANDSLQVEIVKNTGTMKVRFICSGESIVEEKQILDTYIRAVSEIYLLESLSQQVFLLPAERAGLNLFYRELNAARNELVHNLGVNLLNDKLGELQKSLQKSISPYPVPVSDYLTFLNRFDALDNEESPFKDLAQEIQEHILKGSYEVQDQQIFYKNEGGESFHLHISSSAVKSLFGLVFYLTYMATPGQYLIIDEPELNLHPDNQRKLAKVLAKIANRGIKVILSTHSDYIVKEFNNLIMLSKSFNNRDELMKTYGYEESQILSPDDVSPYLFVEDKIVPMEIDPNEGIIAETFDKVINRLNEASDAIYYARQEEQDGN